MNPALQGYLAAMEESLSADGGLEDAGAQLYAFADIVEGNNGLLLAVNDGSVPVAARRSVLDHLLEGKARPEVARLVHQAVSVVPAGELVSAFRWMGGRLEHLANRAAATAVEPFDEDILGRLGSRNRVSGYAAAVFEGCTVAELEEIEDQLFRFARTVEANRALRHALGDRDLPVVVRQEVIGRLLGGQGPGGHRPHRLLRGPRRSGPRHRGHAGHPGRGRRQAPAAGGSPGWPRPIPWTTPSSASSPRRWPS